MTFPINIFEADICHTITSREELQSFAGNYSVIYAAGGIVLNEAGQILMIYRLGRWDFPKGKIEQGEGFETAARREVAEETGINNVKIIKDLPSTFHTYMLNGRKILKHTYWFLMRANSEKFGPIPQTEEDIEEAVWVDTNLLDEKMQNSYPSLRDLVSKIKNDIL